MAVGRIEHQHVDLAPNEFGGALEIISRGTDACRAAQAALAVLRRVRVFQTLLDVLDRDEALQIVVLIDDEQLFDAVLMQDALCFIERRADGNRDQLVLGHARLDREIETRFEPQVAVGEDADEAAFLGGDRNAGDPEAAHHVERFGDPLVRLHRHRVDDHAAFRALHTVDFFRLAIDRHIAMDRADAALLRERNREVRFRHRVHGGGSDRNIQRDISRKPCPGVRIHRQHRRTRGHQQNVVKSEAFLQLIGDHASDFMITSSPDAHPARGPWYTGIYPH